MKTLKTTFRSQDFTHTQIARTGMVAIYLKEKDGHAASFEVVRIRTSKASTRKVTNEAGEEVEIKYEASETYPSDGDWGTHGFSYRSLEAARGRFEGLVAAEAEKEAK